MNEQHPPPTSDTVKRAWEYEWELRRSAVPPPRPPATAPASTAAADGWEKVAVQAAARRRELFALWQERVPGSKAPERLLLEMVQAWANRGYDVTAAERLLPTALAARAAEQWGVLECVTAEIKECLRQAARDPDHLYWHYRHPDSWEEICALTPALQQCQRVAGASAAASAPSVLVTALARSLDTRLRAPVADRIRQAWQGQIAAAAWGTVLEGYSGAVLEQHYGDRLGGYLAPVDTYNDDVVYEVAFLAACEECGGGLTATAIAKQWLRLIPAGWSAEQCALDNLRQGYLPPISARRDNPFSEWIGAQMRAMVCGLVAPATPVAAAYLAWLDGSVSHQANGIYGGLYAAVVTSLAFCHRDPRTLLAEVSAYIPPQTWFCHWYDTCLAACRRESDYRVVWAGLAASLRVFNWIHTFPNMVATVLALWYGAGDFTRSLKILAHCGLDVDCNGGLVGTVLGAMAPIPERWVQPIATGIDTYLPDYAHLTIDELVDWTLRASAALCT